MFRLLLLKPGPQWGPRRGKAWMPLIFGNDSKNGVEVLMKKKDMKKLNLYMNKKWK